MAAKKAKTKSTKSSSAKTMEELLERTDASLDTVNKGDVVDATLKEMGRGEAIFEVGLKSEGRVSDLAFVEVRDFLKTLKPGDTVRALVLDPEDKEGYIVLSVRHAAKEKLWDKLSSAYENEEPITVVGKSVSDKGVMVSVDAMSAFIPMSQLGKKAHKRPQSLVDKSFSVRVLDLNRDKNRIVLSERAVSDAADIARVNKAIEKLSEGERFRGVVTTLVSFGAFVEIKVKVPSKAEAGGKEEVPIEGLVHVSEMSWAKVNDPSEVVTEGEKVDVVVIGIEGDEDDKKQGTMKVAFSMRQAQKDPWAEVVEKYSVDDRVTGKVVRTSDFGVFVELEKGVEGLIHITKIPPGTSFAKGDSVSCYIEDINKAERKISLGIAVTTEKPVGYK